MLCRERPVLAAPGHNQQHRWPATVKPVPSKALKLDGDGRNGPLPKCGDAYGLRKYTNYGKYRRPATPPHKNGRPKFQKKSFNSLFTMLFSTALLCVLIAHFQASSTLKQIKMERSFLRQELGNLDIQDDEKTYVRTLDSLHPLTWGSAPSSYRVCVAFQWVEQGFPEPMKTARSFAGGEEFPLINKHPIATTWVRSRVTINSHFVRAIGGAKPRYP